MVTVWRPAEAIAKIQAYDGTNWQNVKLADPDTGALKVCIWNPDWEQGTWVMNETDTIDGNNCLKVSGFLYGYSGSTWDRLRTHYNSGDITVTATGTTSAIDTVTGFAKHTWTVVSDASESNLTVKLEGSIDNSNWFELDSYSGTADTMRHIVNKPVRYIRFNVTSMGDASSITLRYFGKI